LAARLAALASFLFCFSWSAMATVVLGGLVNTLAAAAAAADHPTDPAAAAAAAAVFTDWGFPFIGNCTFVFSPLIGCVAKRSAAKWRSAAQQSAAKRSTAKHSPVCRGKQQTATERRTPSDHPFNFLCAQLT
jgi:hypothetical protein